MKKFYFTKMHSLGNDFMVIDGVRQYFQLDPELIRRWSNRRTGIGFDQLLIVEARRNNKKADYFYRIFNADGSEVAQCGNGARCLAKFLRDANFTTQNAIMRVETLAGILELKLEEDGNVTVNMGRPIIEQYPHPIEGFDAVILSLGNPHCVIQVEDIENAPVKKISESLAKHPRFPEGVNVGFMQVINRQKIQLRVFERGVGETLACGSGACAAVVAGRILNLLDERVTVTQPGGSAIVTWAGDKSPVNLTGPAEFTFSGEVLVE
jgi:diaminopimelate epimerase